MLSKPLSGDLILVTLDPPNPLCPRAALCDDASQQTAAIMWPLILLPWWLITDPEWVEPRCMPLFMSRIIEFLAALLLLPLVCLTFICLCKNHNLKNNSNQWLHSIFALKTSPKGPLSSCLHPEWNSCKWHMTLTNESRWETTDKKKLHQIPLGN